VRAAPKWKMAMDWEGLIMGGAMTAAVGNTPVRAAVAWPSAGMRSASLGSAQRRAREGKGEASRAASGGFLKRRGRGRGRGSGGGRCVEGGSGEERGVVGMAWDSGAASAGSAPATTRVGDAAWHVACLAEQGREGVGRWAAAIVLGGGTGGQAGPSGTVRTV
jgi:hypothetical protein